MEQTNQTPERNAMGRASGAKQDINNIDRTPPESESPQMKVMGRADGSRTTADVREPNTNLSSRPEQSLGPMGNAAGFPEAYNSGTDAGSAQENTAAYVINNVGDIIRQYPLPAMLIGIGLGYLLSRRSSQRW
jgi:hypothetical protein